jgi:hypothetical protein
MRRTLLPAILFLADQVAGFECGRIEALPAPVNGRALQCLNNAGNILCHNPHHSLCNQLVYTIDEAYIPSYQRPPEMAAIKKSINFPTA